MKPSSCGRSWSEVVGECISLVPSLSHHQVIDSLQYAKMDPGPFHHVNYVNVYLGRQRVGEGGGGRGGH